MFFLAEEKNTTVAKLTQELDAEEFFEWIAYYSLKDEKNIYRINQEIIQEAYPSTVNKEMKNFFSELKARRQNGTKK